MKTTFGLAVLLTALASTTSHAATVALGPAGQGQGFSTEQPSLALTAIVRSSGAPGEIGRVEYFGGNYVPRGYLPADGSLVPIAGNEALFTKLGTTYGGDGTTHFGLPDLRGRTAVGTGRGVVLGQTLGQKTVTLDASHLPAHTHTTDTGPSSVSGAVNPASFENRQPGLGLDFEIITQGIYPSRFSVPIGQTPGANSDPEEGSLAFVTIDAGQDGPEAQTEAARGQIQDITGNVALFSLLGTMHGGDGRVTFGLPDTSGRIVTGQGTGPGLTGRSIGARRGASETELSQATLPAHGHSDPDFGSTGQSGGGQALDNIQEELTLTYVIALQGIYPSRGPGGSSGPFLFGAEPYIGQIAMFAGNFAPRGWATAEGQLLPISQNQALFSILGTSFGGDGRTTFGLPDLRGRTVVGTGAGYFLGQTFGSETISLTAANLPAHDHSVSRLAPVPIPAAGALMILGIGVLGALRRRAL